MKWSIAGVLVLGILAALSAAVLVALVVGCGGLTTEQIAERRKAELTTGSNIMQKDANGNLSSGNREEYERAMDKAVTRPRERSVPGSQ